MQSRSTFAAQAPTFTSAPASNDDQQAPARDPLLLNVLRISTAAGGSPLSDSTGFLFKRGTRLFLVTSRHVLRDEATQHFPDRISFRVHTDVVDLTRTAAIDVALYRDGVALWTQAGDSGGDVDVAAIELHAALPPHVQESAFTPQDLQVDAGSIDLGGSIVIACFPLGFYDTTYLLPVARQGGIASAYGVRFQGCGCFLTDARMHRGSSGAPVLMRRRTHMEGGGPWALLGVHSARMDMGTRDAARDDMLGLNIAWYADILDTLTMGEGAP
jgi:hypothetical protein